MKHVQQAVIGSTALGAAVRLGQNKARVARGEEPLARAHLPFNRRERQFGKAEIDAITNAAESKGLGRATVYRLKETLWDLRRQPDPEHKERFMLAFNSALDRARDLIFEHLEAPRTAFDLYITICVSCARDSNDAQVRRRDLARRCRLSEREVSRHTGGLARLDLLRTEQDGRGVRYVVMPVEDRGFPLWFGDRAARLDAMNEARRRLERERQPELVM